MTSLSKHRKMHRERLLSVKETIEKVGISVAENNERLPKALLTLEEYGRKDARHYVNVIAKLNKLNDVNKIRIDQHLRLP